MQQDKVIVNSIGRKFTAADGKEADSLSVAVGDTFETTGFNTTEKWTLKKLQPTEAEFDVHRRCVSCCANPFTGQPDASKLHWIALVRFPQTQKPAEGKTELKTKARTPED